MSLVAIIPVSAIPIPAFESVPIAESIAKARIHRVFSKPAVLGHPWRFDAKISTLSSNIPKNIESGVQLLGPAVDLLPNGPVKDAALTAFAAGFFIGIKPAEVLSNIKILLSNPRVRLLNFTKDYFRNLEKMDKLDASRKFLNDLELLVAFLPEEPRRAVNAAIVACNLACMARIRWLGHVPKPS
jgi:hypothetical protein